MPASGGTLISSLSWKTTPELRERRLRCAEHRSLHLGAESHFRVVMFPRRCTASAVRELSVLNEGLRNYASPLIDGVCPSFPGARLPDPDLAALASSS
ncbi:hypothetical protein KM043_005216 [Ampulex compressa]|nr:hypothetical protein KM043_005216 [Ampulex compressa]